MNEYTTNQPINHQCNCKNDWRSQKTAENTIVCAKCGQMELITQSPYEKKVEPNTLTPPGEALQTNCPRCNMRLIAHNCPAF